MNLPERNPIRHLASVMLAVVGIIHVLPLSGALGSERLAMLYGLSFAEPNLAILMRHRAVLFGLLGLFLIFAAFRPLYRTVAFVAGFVSVVAFLWLAWSVGGYNAEIERVFWADVLALVCLVLGVAAHVCGAAGLRAVASRLAKRPGEGRGGGCARR